PVQLNFTSRFRGEHRSGACYDFGKGCSSGRVTDLGNGTGHRFGKRAGWAGAGVCGLTGVGYIRASPHVRLKTALLVGAGRPSDQTAGRPALPPAPMTYRGTVPALPIVPTTTALASVFRSPTFRMLCCRRWHNRTPSQPETRDKSIRAPRLFE